MVSREFLETHICPNCHVAIMEDHPSLYSWIKCIVCGFSKPIQKKNKETITGNDTNGTR